MLKFTPLLYFQKQLMDHLLLHYQGPKLTLGKCQVRVKKSGFGWGHKTKQFANWLGNFIRSPNITADLSQTVRMIV